jgi:hypothetical protein
MPNATCYNGENPPPGTPKEKQATAVYPALHTARVSALTATLGCPYEIISFPACYLINKRVLQDVSYMLRLGIREVFKTLTPLTPFGHEEFMNFPEQESKTISVYASNRKNP